MPQNHGVVRPHWSWFALLDGGMVMLTVLSFGGGAYDAVSGRSPVPLPPRQVLRAILAGAVVIHISEALVAGRRARQRGLPARGWALQTLAVGFPSLLALGRAGAPAEPGSPVGPGDLTATPGRRPS